MSRHDRDAVSLMGGLLLVLIAGAFLVGDLTTVDVDGRWIAPIVLIAVGAAGLLSTLRPRGEPAPGPADEPVPGPADEPDLPAPVPTPAATLTPDGDPLDR